MCIKNILHKKKKNISLLKIIEICLIPILIIGPIVVSIFFLQDWYYRGFTFGISTYDGELIVAVLILIGNILFDIPFIKSIKLVRIN